MKIHFRQNLANLKRSSFIKNTFVVMSGTVLAQALGYGLSPVISRLFSPEDFGLFGSFYAVVGVIAAVITLDYSTAIMLPKPKADGFSLFALSCLSTAIIGACCLVACLLAPAIFKGFIKTRSTGILVLFIIAIFVNGLNQACQSWCVRSKAFKHTSASQVVRSLSANGTQIGLGYMKGGASALILGGILGDVLATVNLARVVVRDLKILRQHVQWNRIWGLAKEYRDFPIYSASRNVMNSLSLGLPIFLLARFYGIATAGAYAFGMRILSAPMEFILRALRQVLYQKASETYNEGGKLVPLYVKITGGLFTLALFPTLILLIWAPSLFSLIFGARWHMAGIFAQSLIIWLMFMFCNLPALLFARIIRMQRQMFFFDLILLTARAGVLILGGMYFPASITIMLFSIVGALMNIAFMLIIGFGLVKREGDVGFKKIINNLKEG